MIEIKYHGKTAHLSGRKKIMSVIRYLAANGIEIGEDDYVCHVIDHPLKIDGVRPVAIDEAIEVLR